MRIQISKIIITIAAFTLSSPKSMAGSEGGGAGNTQIAEFFLKARAFASYMDIVGGKPGIPVPAGGFTHFLTQVNVTTTNRPLQLNGETVEALNHPSELLIELDDVEWSKRNVQQKYQIVVQQLLGLMRLPDPGYDFSRILEQDANIKKGSSTFAESKTRASKDPLADIASRRNSDGSGSLQKNLNSQLEFYALANSFALYMDQYGSKSGIPTPNGGFKNFIERVNVKPAQRSLELNGMKVDAINYPSESSIEFDELSWSEHRLDRKYQIVIHELLGLLMIDDHNYSVSEKLFRDSYEQLKSPVPNSKSGSGSRVNQGPIKYKSISTNFDGSITIVSPRLKYGDQFFAVLSATESYRVSCVDGHGTQKSYPDSLSGLCAVFGKSQAMHVETSMRIEEISGQRSSAIELNKSGSFKRLVSTYFYACASSEPTTNISVVDKITCK